ncbi:Predicted nucleotidyltransferase [Granulicatella balaenopterae]|uniref:tRNA(Met) cytidine acetate ligase n=2 Tax=Granulicatella balaenopterae TaxID=137733 RepID=A0A1H9ICV9_9LACT|nr:Predicted nucleotidyltransferase [Granulicatella balaenopterae]
MRACGIIAEYNPFHQGHQYQLECAKRESGADVIIVAMSGNFVQRGEPAIFDKWTRAKMALKQGADIILEVPTIACVQSSDYFAKAGVCLLADAGCFALSFGSEEAGRKEFTRAFEQWCSIEDKLHQSLKEAKDLKHLSYPRQIAELVARQYPKACALQEILKNPNQQLGFSYLKAIHKEKPKMEIFPIKRVGANHNDEEAYLQQFASGTAIRQVLCQSSSQLHVDDSFLAKQLALSKEELTEFLDKQAIVSWESYWSLLQYRLVTWSEEELRQIYQMNEGIEVRLKKFASSATSFADFLAVVKNKRWTQTRLQRLLIYCLLGITKEEVERYFSEGNQAIQVLGFSSNGREYLKALKKSSAVPFITNYASTKDIFKKQYQIDQVYRLADSAKILEQNIKRIPIIIT